MIQQATSFQGSPMRQRFSEVSGQNNVIFGQDRHKVIISYPKILLYFRCVAAFWNKGDRKGTRI